MSGKGDTYRPVDPKKWATEWERIFRASPHLRHRPEPDTLPPHTQEGHGESDPAEND